MHKNIEKTIHIEGMHCEGCINRVSNVLSNIKEVKTYQVELGKAVIILKKDIDLNIIKEKIENLGFKVRGEL